MTPIPHSQFSHFHAHSGLAQTMLFITNCKLRCKRRTRCLPLFERKAINVGPVLSRITHENYTRLKRFPLVRSTLLKTTRHLTGCILNHDHEPRCKTLFHHSLTSRKGSPVSVLRNIWRWGCYLFRQVRRKASRLYISIAHFFCLI